jgi:hypothetical protein
MELRNVAFFRFIIETSQRLDNGVVLLLLLHHYKDATSDCLAMFM